MKPLGDQLFARTPLANDQHGTVKRRRLACAFDRVLKCGRLTDELRFTLHSQSLAKFPADWQGNSASIADMAQKRGFFCAFEQLAHPLHSICRTGTLVCRSSENRKVDP